MVEAVGRHGGMAGVLASGSSEQNLPGPQERQVQDERFCDLPLLEICDEDYRSFCWPCHALEEPGDCQ